MYPKLFGVIDSYSVMIVLAIISAFGLLLLYLWKRKTSKEEIIDIIICGCAAVACGLIFAILFENLYELVQDVKSYTWTWGMTFYGGLFGGILGYFLMYVIYVSRHSHSDVSKVVIIAPACITLAHAIGRIGCFLEGCCYGKDTSEWYGLYFQSLGRKVIPTQLFESIFLFILSGVLIFLAFKFNYRYTFVIYFIAYPIFRFLIEFIRADDRGGFIGIFSPSQIWSMVMIIAAIPLLFLLKRVIFKKKSNAQA